MVPTFTMHRLTGEVTSSAPAASPRVRRRLSSWPLGRKHNPTSESPSRACAAVRPMSARVRAGGWLVGLWRWFLSYTFPSCLPDPDHLAVLTRPVVVRAAPALPCASRVRLPSASPACCDRPAAESFHLRPDAWRLVAHVGPDPAVQRGARHDAARPVVI